MQIARESSGRTYPIVGVPEGHHPVSHHQNDPHNVEQNTKINAYHMSLFARFAEKLRNTPDGDGTLLDHSIRAGAGVNIANRYGVRPLSLAATNGSAPIVARLLDAGADSNTTLPEGETVLMTAARTGTTEVIKLLIARGADVNARDGSRGQKALMWAAGRNNADAVRLMVEAGADINVRTRPPRPPSRPSSSPCARGTCLRSARSSPPRPTSTTRCRTVRARSSWRRRTHTGSWPISCSTRAAANDMGETALHGVAFRGVNAVVEYLVDKGARLDAKDSRG